MSRIVYLSPFSRSEITGGVKVAFRHVEMLRDLGFDAYVHSPDGPPVWLATRAPLYAGPDPAADAGNVLVFPEVLNGPLAQLARAKTPARKVMLCQNQYYAFSEALAQQTFAELGFVRLLTVSEIARGFLERVFAPAVFDVVPVCIDAALFRPREKQRTIAVFPRKLPIHFGMIRRIFAAKYPALRDVPWSVIDVKTESQAAHLLGTATVLLALNDRESVGLTPLEAMASGCVVVGFHGYGGQEYASEANGIWLRPDFLEETADALAQAVLGVDAGEPRFTAIKAAGFATAARFNETETRAALARVFTPLVGALS
jgi:glycosyltransferase involved in cell wall biosynthesis